MPSSHSDGHVVHSIGRIIPDDFPVTQLQQIADQDGIGKITCIVSSGSARFFNPSRTSLGVGITQHLSTSENLAALVVETNNSDTFQNRDVYCGDSEANHIYLYLTSSNTSE